MEGIIRVPCPECGGWANRVAMPSERDGTAWPDATEHWDRLALLSHRAHCPGERGRLYAKALGKNPRGDLTGV